MTDNKKYKVVVVIPAYNAADYVLETISSILASTFSDFLLVIINDGSTDDTSQVVRRIDDPRVRLIDRSNAGMSASRNYGINLFDSDFIALCDADDIWHPRKLELQLKVMRENLGVEFCFTEFSKYYGGGVNGFNNAVVNDKLDANLSGYIYHKMLLTNWALPSSVVFTKRLWEELGPFLCEDHQTDDWEYFVRASRVARFAKLKSGLVLYRQPLRSLSRRVPLVNSTEKMRGSFIRKYGLVSPQGIKCDVKELHHRMYLGKRNFFDTHVYRGDFFKGLIGFGNMIAFENNRLATFITLLKSCRRKVIRNFDLADK